MARIPNPGLRSERARRAILDAALELAVRDGCAKVTVEAIAAAAGVGKQTIYRWWPGKAAVVLEALDERIGAATLVADTGDLAADLAAQLGAVVGLMTTDLGEVYRGLLAEAQGDARLAADIRARFIEPRGRLLHDRLSAAVAAGELRADIPPRRIIELLFGPVYYRLLLGTDVLDPGEAAERVGYLLDGLRSRGRTALRG